MGGSTGIEPSFYRTAEILSGEKTQVIFLAETS